MCEDLSQKSVVTHEQNIENNQAHEEVTRGLKDDSITDEVGVIKNSKQLLNEFKELDAEIKFGIKEVENQFQKIISEISGIAEEVKSMNLALDKNLSLLSKETTVLTILPKKLSDHLSELVPQIANHVQKEGFKEYDRGLENSRSLLEQLNEKLESATRKITNLELDVVRAKLKSSILLISVSLVLSSSITFAMFKFLPRTVTIDTKGDITIDGSNVSVWGTSKNSGQLVKKTKSN